MIYIAPISGLVYVAKIAKEFGTAKKRGILFVEREWEIAKNFFEKSCGKVWWYRIFFVTL